MVTLSPLFTGIILLLALKIHIKEDIYGVPSGILLLYWLFSSISFSVKTFDTFQNPYYLKNGTKLISYTILYCFLLSTSVITFFLEYIPFNYFRIPSRYSALDSKANTALLDNADIFSRFAFSWMNPLITKATEGEITPQDLPLVDSNCNSKDLAEKFLSNWKRRKNDDISQLIFCLLKSFGKLVALSGIIEFFTDALALAQPFFLQYLIRFAQSYYTEDPIPVPIGFYISFGMFIVSMIRTFCKTNAFVVNINLMLSVRGSVSSVIYQKALRISSKARQERSTGEIVNLMSTDVPVIVKIFYMISSLWQAPIKLVMCLAGLYHLLGVSAFAGPTLIAAILPLNSYLASRLKHMRRKQMKYKDKRIRQTTEILTNMRSLKLYGWEPPLIEKLKHVRNNKQLKNLKKLIVFSFIIDFMWVIIPCIITTASFGAFAFLEKTPLTPDIVFPCLSLFVMMNGPILEFPRTLVSCINSLVSFQRVRDFLVAEEISNDKILRFPSTQSYTKPTVEVNDATFGWSSNPLDGIALRNITFEARKTELVCIVGKVGCGKTSFLQAILGELHCFEGWAATRGNVAYVSQDMWLMNATLRENILFGHRYDETFYNLTIEACALTPDIALLPDGDQTEIGEMGISLSGGQKARVSLARAVYARADIYLLDDSLSAVDEHVMAHIMDHVLSSKGLLSSKTRIFATNSIHVLERANTIVLLEDGRITQRDTYQNIVSSTKQSRLKNLIDEFGRKSYEGDSATGSPQQSNSVSTSSVTIPSKPLYSNTLTVPTRTKSRGDAESNISDLDENQESAIDDAEDFDNDLEPFKHHQRQGSTATLRRASLESLDTKFRSKGSLKQSTSKRTKKIEEKAEQGHVKWSIYAQYIKACGIGSVILTIFVVIISSLDSVTTKFWLKHWSELNRKNGGNEDVKYYLGVYLAIGVVFALLGVARKAVVRIYCGLNASKKLHDEMLLAVTRSPMQFFETTPIGRIINRFSGDVVELDESLPSNFLEMIWVITDILISVCVIVYGSSMILVVLVPLVLIYSYYQKYYASASRALKRLLVISRSPIYSHFQETLTGSKTIRAFDQVERFEHINSVNLDYNLRAIFLFRGVNRWLSMRQQTIGSLLTLATALFVTYGAINKSITPGLIGVVMGYSAALSEDISYFIKTMVSLETSIIAVERILEYCGLKSEAPEIIEDNRPDKSWPKKGAITFDHYSTRYRENLDLILKDISLDIKPSEKIGVVGRTGAGKSSLIMSLFRIIEPVEGRIIIDGIDISKIGLADLRKNLSIIPQDSQIFEGSIRQNLDPLHAFSDDQIWKALELSHLKDFVLNLDNKLDSVLTEGGSNISGGQKQLMCLGRALLHDSAILVLDEATASVDVSTDKLIQETIRTAFKDKTIVTIAHRLNTILDSDRILLLDQGEVREFDTPENLLKDESTLFYSLCKKGGFVQ